jgi:acyl dehydratase
MAYSAQHLFFDDLTPEITYESVGRTVTETDIVNFAGLSGDFNPIHMDHHFAASTPFRRPIAHGLLVFSIASGLATVSPPVRTQAFLGVREWHFRTPVFIGDTLRMRSRVLEKTLKGRGRRGEVVWQRMVVNQEDRIVQEGTLLTLVEARPPAAPA